MLRYTNEVCYVFIISIESDALPFPLVEDDDEILEPNGLTRDGRIVDSETIPNFWPKNVVSWYRGESYSYATGTFAFYYKDAGSSLKVKKSKYEKGPIRHDEKYCLKKVWVCPSKLK